ncbi:hypothetical protein [Clostridium sp. E02]|uniref:hypothetical protein n=1 Tax=Clostridium sp. E02 TaxID=2487134 RepID=UPI000F5320C2|nr:hypothetical protein [Clostridium sp. E02]
MRLNLLPKATVINPLIINQNLNSSSVKNRSKDKSDFISQIGRKDSVLISKQGKKISMIEQLMDQKELIQQSKDNLLESGLKEGNAVNQDKMKEYDEQLKNIDKQIAKAMMDETTEETKNKLNSNKKNENQPITEQDFQNQRNANIISSSSTIEQSKVLLSKKNKMDGEANVLRTEIKSDGSKALKSKFKRISEIENKSSDLLKQVEDKLSDAIDLFKDSDKNINLVKNVKSLKSDRSIRKINESDNYRKEEEDYVSQRE